MSDTLQARVERHPLGRAALSVVAVVIVLAIVTPNLPAAPLTDTATDVVRPIRDAAGLDGSWSVFAPGPRRAVITVEARLDYADGTVRRWQPPTADRFTGAYRYYHWQKWMEQAYADGFRHLWRPLAFWLARTRTVDGAHPTTVTLVRRWRNLAPPEGPTPVQAWQEEPYFTYQVDEADFR